MTLLYELQFVRSNCTSSSNPDPIVRTTVRTKRTVAVQTLTLLYELQFVRSNCSSSNPDPIVRTSYSSNVRIATVRTKRTVAVRTLTLLFELHLTPTLTTCSGSFVQTVATVRTLTRCSSNWPTIKRTIKSSISPFISKRQVATLKKQGFCNFSYRLDKTSAALGCSNSPFLC